ncbi:MAG: efflux RND transporter permease subunit [Dehalococcoidia bacterium]|nr:efflux RND transporter permease subunit [Dehalococcoidia bacterium]
MLSLLNWLIELALRRAVIMAVVVAALFAGGLYAATQIKIELLPDVEFPAMTVVTTYPGAGPQEVVDDVTRPMERAAGTLEGLKRMQTVSSEGLSILLLEFGYGTDMRQREETLATRLRGAGLPAAASQPSITRINPQLIPVIQLSLGGDLPVEELERIAREEVVPELSAIDGVLRVELIGGAVPQVNVRLDPAKLRELNVSTQTIANAVRAANVAVPSGSVTSDDITVPVRTYSATESLEQLQGLVVANGAEGPVRLSEVAEVTLGRSPTQGAARTNGRPSIAISISKSPEANTVRVANDIQSTVDRLRGEIGDEAELIIVYDQSVQIERSIAGMLREGGWGALFAVLVVFLFLLSIRSTFVTAISIPLSVVVAVLLMYWLDFTLNIFTLGGLTIAIGRVIDDSIVVLENIYRHVHEEGEKIGSAVRSAPREVASAITSSTLTTVAVFVPLGLIGGLVGEVFQPFGFTVSFALLASLAVALMVVPGLARVLVGRGAAKESEETWLQRIYTPILRWSLRHRIITLGSAAALFLVSLFLLRTIPVSLLPQVMENVFDITVIAPAGSDIDAVLTEAEKVEEVLAQTPGIETYETVVGGQTQSLATLGAALAGRGFSSAHMFVRPEEGVDAGDLADRVREEVKQIETNSLISVSDIQTSTLSRLQVTAWSEQEDALREAGPMITEAAAAVEGVENVVSDVARERPEIGIQVDANAAFLAGLSPQEIAAYMRDLLIGQTVAQAPIDNDRSADVVLTIAAENLADLENLRQLPVGSNGVPLDSVADVELVQRPAQITRVDERPAVTVTGDIVAKDTAAAANKVKDDIEALDLPESVEVQVGGVLSQIEESFNSMYVGIGLAIVLVYIVMVLFFGSLLEPFVILFSLPLATIGAFFALYITDRTLSLSALIGILMLVGIVVTNAIVLMDLVRRLVQEGSEPRDALIQGGRTRLRPILMTALATMLALVPLAMGFHQGALVAAELATVVIGGLFTSTFLTLLVVPVVYSIVMDLRGKMRMKPVATRPAEIGKREEPRTEKPEERPEEPVSARFRRLPRPREKEER